MKSHIHRTNLSLLHGLRSANCFALQFILAFNLAVWLGFQKCQFFGTQASQLSIGIMILRHNFNYFFWTCVIFFFPLNNFRSAFELYSYIKEFILHTALKSKLVLLFRLECLMKPCMAAWARTKPFFLTFY